MVFVQILQQPWVRKHYTSLTEKLICELLFVLSCEHEHNLENTVGISLPYLLRCWVLHLGLPEGFRFSALFHIVLYVPTSKEVLLHLCFPRFYLMIMFAVYSDTWLLVNVDSLYGYTVWDQFGFPERKL